MPAKSVKSVNSAHLYRGSRQDMWLSASAVGPVTEQAVEPLPSNNPWLKCFWSSLVLRPAILLGSFVPKQNLQCFAKGCTFHFDNQISIYGHIHKAVRSQTQTLLIRPISTVIVVRIG